VIAPTVLRSFAAHRARLGRYRRREAHGSLDFRGRRARYCHCR
jgi:hypothetical protein